MAKLLTILNLIMLPKGHNYSFNAYLSAHEVDCKCKNNTCHYTLVNPEAIGAFYEVRLEINRPLLINSFYRCQAHNASPSVGGKEHSSHTTGNALDISTRGFSDYEKEKLIELCNEKFDYVKIYDTFIHCQINA